MRCIAFVSPLGGTGQTTVVANLASLWSADGLPVLALDLCAQNSLGLHLGLDQAPATGWASQVETQGWWAEPALENSAQVRFLPFGQAPTTRPGEPARTHLAQVLAQQPQWLSTQLQALALEDHSLVLLDAPAWPHPLALQALACADLVVVCLDASPRTNQASALVQALAQQVRPGAALALLATGFNPRRDAQRQALHRMQQQWPDSLAPYVLHDDEAVAAALSAHHCVTAFAPQAQAAHDLNGMAHWLLARCPYGEAVR